MVEFNSKGEVMFSCSEDKSIKIFKWNGNEFDLTFTFVDAHLRAIYTIAFDSTHNLLISVC